MKEYLKAMNFEPKGLTADAVTPADLPGLFLWYWSPQGHNFWAEQSHYQNNRITDEGRKALRQFFLDAESDEP